MGMLSYVLARKNGILIKDLVELSDEQLVFEYVSALQKNKAELKDNAEIAKAVLVNLLGLNMLAPKDENGNAKRLSPEERMSNILPLSVIIGSEWFMKELSKQEEELKAADSVTVDADDEYNRRFNDVAASMSDMAPPPVPLKIDTANLIWNSKDMKDAIERYVKIQENADVKPRKKIRLVEDDNG